MSEAVERRKAYSKVLYGPFPQLCSSLYVYSAVAPLSGKHFFTEEAKLNTNGFRTFIDGLAERFEASFNVLVLDNGSFHKANRLDIPENVALVFLPPYSPEFEPGRASVGGSQRPPGLQVSCAKDMEVEKQSRLAVTKSALRKVFMIQG